MRVWTLLALAACSGENPTAEECAEEDKILVFADSDKDGFGGPDTSKLVCPPLNSEDIPTGALPAGFSGNDDDCDDNRADVSPAAIEACDGLDNDCDRKSDEGLRELLFFLDGDGDGFGNPESDLGITACSAPAGYVDNSFDCEDADATIHPDAIEICDNGVDNDCDDRADDQDPTQDLVGIEPWYFDADHDGYGDPETEAVQCLPPSPEWVRIATPELADCDDGDELVNPSATEVCNHVDDDCDQHIDDSDTQIDTATQTRWYADADGDGTGDPDAFTEACWQPWFYVDNTDDCDDTNPFLGLPAPWLRDRDGDGFGAGVPSADGCLPPGGGDWVLAVFGRDCDDDPLTGPFVNPDGTEICDGGIDNDCDLLVDDLDDTVVFDPLTDTYYLDADGDTFGDEDEPVLACAQPADHVVDATDCDDDDFDIHLGATEVCDGVDNDCDRAIDDQDNDVDPTSALTWYEDFDFDNFGDDAQSRVSCSQPQYYVSTGGDCDPFDGDTYPGAPEVCGDTIDQDCDGGDLSCFAPSGPRLRPMTERPEARPRVAR